MVSARVRPEAVAHITLPESVMVEPEKYVHYSAEAIYNVPRVPAVNDLTTWDGWVGGIRTSSEDKLRVEANVPSGNNAQAVKTFTRLIPGRTYTFSARVRAYATGREARVYISGMTVPALVTAPNDFNGLTLSYAFTASATSHSVVLDSSPKTGGAATAWDELLLQADEYMGWVPAVYDDEAVLPISEGQATFADDWNPYVQATFTVPITNEALLEQVDPRDNSRILVQANEAIEDTSLSLDLGLRERTVNHESGTVTLTAMSDEALLMDRTNVSTSIDATARVHEASLRAVCNWALAKIGASLEAGTADADLTAYWNAKNLAIDAGTAATTPGGLYSAGNATLDPNDTSWSISGDGDSFNIWNPTSFDSHLSLAQVADKVKGQPETTFVLSATGNMKSVAGGTESADRSRALVVIHKRPSDPGYTYTASNKVPNVVNTPTRVSVAFKLPEGTSEVYVRAYLGHTTGQIRWDGFTLVERSEGTLADDSVYFDGNTTDTSRYTYAFEGVTNNSISTRVATVERSPELYNWMPGQTLWDFLKPLIEAAGLRLFCDEERKWRLVNPATYQLPGYTVVQEGYNATRGTDSISRNDDTWADAVVVTYNQPDGTTKYDVAGDPLGKANSYTYDQAYPGPGRAAYLLWTLTSRGRTQDVTAMAKYTVRPGQAITVNLPGTNSQTGQVREVIFDLRQGLADIGTRGLTEVFPGSVDALAGTIDSLTGTIDSL